MSTALTPAQNAVSNKREAIRSMLTKCTDKLEEALRGTILTPQKMLVVAMTAVAKSPKLLDCTPVSVALAVQMAAEAALPVDGYHAHLIPYGTTCQLIIDYKGLVRLAEDGGVHIDPYVVYEKDVFQYELGINPILRHIPSDEEDRGPLKCAYAVATHADGFKRFIVMSRRDILKRKAASRSSGGKDSPWTNWEEEMWKKTVVKQISKLISRTARMDSAVMNDDLVDTGKTYLHPRASDIGMLPETKTSMLEDALAEEPLVMNHPPVVLDSPPVKFSLAKFEKAIQNCETVDELTTLFDDQVRSIKEELDADIYEKAYQACQTKAASIRGK